MALRVERRVFTPLAPLATLLLFPFVSVTLIVGYVQVALTPLLPNLAAQLSPLLGTLADGLTTLASALERWPLLSVDLYPVPAWAAALMAVGIVVAAHRRKVALTRAWACVVLMAAATASIALTQLPLAPAGKAELAVLDVRHGVCVVLRCPSGRTVLLDAGSRTLPDPGQRTLLPFLRHRRWPTPTGAFISHANLDHYNALPTLLKRRKLRQVFLNDYFGAAADSDGPVGRLMDMFARAGADVVRLHRGERVHIDDRTAVTVLWPPPAGTGYDGLGANDSSLVLRLESHGRRVLLPGDVQHLAQRLLLELPVEDLRADVLILPHHGSFSPALAEFIDAVDPQVVIRSAARRRTGAVEQIRGLAVNRHFFSTDVDGCITVRLADDALHVRAFASPRPPLMVGR